MARTRKVVGLPETGVPAQPAGRWRWAVTAMVWVMLTGAGRAAVAERIGMISPFSEGLPSGRLKQLERVVRRLLVRSAGLQVVPPDVAFTRIAREGRLLGRRREASDLLVRAAALVSDMRYSDATTTLQSAENAAMEGLAWLVDPKLLADIHLLRGITLLPTDRAAGEEQLQQSFALWPDREGAPVVLSPKLAQAVERAAEMAKSAPLLPIKIEDARAAAKVLEVDRLLVLSVHQRGDEERARILLAGKQATAGWVGSDGLRWRRGASSAKVRSRLQHALRTVLRDEESGAAVPARGKGRSVVAPWILAGVSAACLAGGSVLLAMSFARLSDAEAQAGRPELVEYYPEVQELERSARAYRTASIVLLSGAAAGSIAAVAVWLWPRRDRHRSRDVAVGFGPSSISLSLAFR